MSVATRMVLLVNVIAVGIITFVMVHTKSRCMALVQPVKNMAAVGVDVMGAGMVKNLL
jgi:hypothetical protein